VKRVKLHSPVQFKKQYAEPYRTIILLKRPGEFLMMSQAQICLTNLKRGVAALMCKTVVIYLCLSC